MADVAALLQTMHAMREPPPPTPVVPFLATLALGCLAALGLAAAIVALRSRRASLRAAARAALQASRALPPADRLAAQAGLLRRLVRALVGEEKARVQGAAWLATLDSTFKTTFFSSGAGAIFGDALYGTRTPPDIEGLDRSLAGLIETVRA